jgi:hypothetical protein
VHRSSPLLHLVLPVPVLLPLPSPLSVPEGGGAKLPSGVARGAVDALELSESGEYSSDVPPSDSSDE